MPSTNNSVTVTIAGGPSATVPWQQGMTALQAMELAQGIIEPDPNQQFTFGLQYYGASLGYLVNMINETYDSFISKGGESASPFFYWQFLVNSQPTTQSIDRTILSAGDEIRFEFEIYIAERHQSTLLSSKHKYQTR